MPRGDDITNNTQLSNTTSYLQTAQPAAFDDDAWCSAPAERLKATGARPSQQLAADFEVPNVDMARDDASAAAALHAAASDVGFFYVTNHGVPDELLERQFRESAAFFAQPAEEKLKLQADSSNRGYHPPGLGTAKNPFKQADRKEAYNAYLGFETDDVDKPFHGRNRWPDPAAVPGFRPAIEAYYAAMASVAHRLLRLIALGLGLDAAFFDASFSAATSNVRVIHYLPGEHSARDGIFGVGPHTDWGMLTVLATDPTPGLQIRHAGAWIDVAPRPGAFVVNIGDLLHRWSGGRFKSTLHRVEKRSAAERYSSPFFCAPNWDAVIAPLPGCEAEEAYEPITAGQWLMKRRDAEYGNNQMLRVE
jgi:isopenicillin N synthase-like dioxygenase